MDGSLGGFSSGGRGRKTVLESEDLQEEEVWAMVKAREGSNSNTRKNFACDSSSSACRFNAIPTATADGGGHQEFSATECVARHQSSAPVDIPDRSRILKKRCKKNLWVEACDAHNDDDYGDGCRRFRHGKVDEAESSDDDEMVPPHEYLARRLASTQIASFSMCEGVGRTLKGRDLSKLRDAILTKTGFIE
ncbi:hypothetical protein Pfo_023230 [Paulownia fortunei]|nr:hypothetical protein Pfo_023230 [Paulownia fortunei]